jgi:cation transport regulator
MPYEVNADLSPSVRSHLPDPAQSIFREAFNHAYAAHARDPRQEEAAFRIAWAAVKRVYEKTGDEWVERDR